MVSLLALKRLEFNTLSDTDLRRSLPRPLLSVLVPMLTFAVPRFKSIVLLRFWVIVLDLFWVMLILLSGSWMVLTQLSVAGFNSISPVYTTTLNGFTFSTVVAIGCSIQSISSYFKVTEFPVFWILGSNNSKLSLRSIFWGVIRAVGAIWDLTEFLLITGANSSAVGLTSIEDNSLSIKE